MRYSTLSYKQKIFRRRYDDDDDYDRRPRRKKSGWGKKLAIAAGATAALAGATSLANKGAFGTTAQKYAGNVLKGVGNAAALSGLNNFGANLYAKGAMGTVKSQMGSTSGVIGQTIQNRNAFNQNFKTEMQGFKGDASKANKTIRRVGYTGANSIMDASKVRAHHKATLPAATNSPTQPQPQPTNQGEQSGQQGVGYKVDWEGTKSKGKNLWNKGKSLISSYYNSVTGFFGSGGKDGVVSNLANNTTGAVPISNEVSRQTTANADAANYEAAKKEHEAKAAEIRRQKEAERASNAQELVDKKKEASSSNSRPVKKLHKSEDIDRRLGIQKDPAQIKAESYRNSDYYNDLFKDHNTPIQGSLFNSSDFVDNTYESKKPVGIKGGQAPAPTNSGGQLSLFDDPNFTAQPKSTSGGVVKNSMKTTTSTSTSGQRVVYNTGSSNNTSSSGGNQKKQTRQPQQSPSTGGSTVKPNSTIRSLGPNEYINPATGEVIRFN